MVFENEERKLRALWEPGRQAVNAVEDGIPLFKGVPDDVALMFAKAFAVAYQLGINASYAAFKTEDEALTSDLLSLAACMDISALIGNAAMIYKGEDYSDIALAVAHDTKMLMGLADDEFDDDDEDDGEHSVLDMADIDRLMKKIEDD